MHELELLNKMSTTAVEDPVSPAAATDITTATAAPPIALTSGDDQLEAGPLAVTEAEADDYDDDADSGIGNSHVSSTATIGGSILNYRKENGRTYHAYKDGKYILPNDEEEADRLDLQHHLFNLTFDNKLFVAPIPKDKPLNRVLDVGTGTGIWAIDFADAYPESQVFGVDLSPIQPVFIPPNLTFEVDDVEEPWTFTRKFDFIHCRMLIGSFISWPRFFEQSFEHLSPRGFVEVVDICFPARSNDDSVPPDSPQMMWGKISLEAFRKLGRSGDSCLQYKEQLLAAGFENVVEVIYKWPMNRWPKNPKLKELGMWTQENIAGNLEGLSMAAFTRGLGWTREQLEVFLVDVRKDMKDTKVHAWLPIYVVYGQKPE